MASNSSQARPVYQGLESQDNLPVPGVKQRGVEVKGDSGTSRGRRRPSRSRSVERKTTVQKRKKDHTSEKSNKPKKRKKAKKTKKTTDKRSKSKSKRREGSEGSDGSDLDHSSSSSEKEPDVGAWEEKPRKRVQLDTSQEGEREGEVKVQAEKLKSATDRLPLKNADGGARGEDLLSGLFEASSSFSSCRSTGRRQEAKEAALEKERHRTESKARERELNVGLHAPPRAPRAPPHLPLQAGNSSANASWLRRALQRTREQAERDGQSVEEVAAERWGSLARLQALLATAEENEKPSSSRWKTSNKYGSGSRTKDPWRRKEAREERHQERREERNDRNQEMQSSQEETSRSDGSHKEDKVTEKALECPLLLSKDELNKLGAKIAKAELLGNLEQAAKLKGKLASAKEVSERLMTTKGEKRVVTLTHTDIRGRTMPVSRPKEATQSAPKKSSFNKDGFRETYYANDDRFTLAEVVKAETMGYEDPNAVFHSIGKSKGPKVSEDYDLDDLYVDRAARVKPGQQAEKQKEHLVREHREVTRRLDNCTRCCSSKLIKKHLIVSIKDHCYLALPDGESLTEGHCLIIPNEHVPCATQLDENVWEEMQQFRRTLVQMFKAREQDCVFFETALGLNGNPHMVLQCVPIENDFGSMAPMYFQKAIQECESEWTDNKKLISLQKKNLRLSIPKGLPYFHVDFGLDDGYAHVVEDEKLFSKMFGIEIIGGMLEMEPTEWLRRKPITFDKQRQVVLKFSSDWQKYKW